MDFPTTYHMSWATRFVSAPAQQVSPSPILFLACVLRRLASGANEAIYARRQHTKQKRRNAEPGYINFPSQPYQQCVLPSDDNELNLQPRQRRGTANHGYLCPEFSITCHDQAIKIQIWRSSVIEHVPEPVKLRPPNTWEITRPEMLIGKLFQCSPLVFSLQ